MGVAVLHQPGKSVRTLIVWDSWKSVLLLFMINQRLGFPPPPQNHRTGSNRIFPVAGEMECIPHDAVVAFVLHVWGKTFVIARCFLPVFLMGGFHAIGTKKAHGTSGPNGLKQICFFCMISTFFLRSWFALCLHSWELAIKTTLWSPVQFRKVYLNPVFRIRIRIQSGQRIPDQGGQKLPTKREKSLEISCWMSSFEG